MITVSSTDNLPKKLPAHTREIIRVCALVEHLFHTNHGWSSCPGFILNFGEIDGHVITGLREIDLTSDPASWLIDQLEIITELAPTSYKGNPLGSAIACEGLTIDNTALREETRLHHSGHQLDALVQDLIAQGHGIQHRRVIGVLQSGWNFDIKRIRTRRDTRDIKVYRTSDTQHDTEVIEPLKRLIAVMLARQEGLSP